MDPQLRRPRIAGGQRLGAARPGGWTRARASRTRQALARAAGEAEGAVARHQLDLVAARQMIDGGRRRLAHQPLEAAQLPPGRLSSPTALSKRIDRRRLRSAARAR